MTPDRTAFERSLLDDLTAAFPAAFAAMTGERVAAHWEPAAHVPDAALGWKQPFAPLAGALWISVPDDQWRTAGKQILASAGVEDAGEAEIRAGFVEFLTQALGALAQSLSSRLSREITVTGGREVAASGAPVASWAVLRVGSLLLYAGIETALTEADRGDSSRQNPEAFDLLLDVELPVSVSFGRASVPLKEVLKLSTGSIVELNRAVADPVDIVVNNCVIARGEVVVVEGNFGVRVLQVMSRQDRLRSFE